MEEELEPRCLTRRHLLELHPHDASLALDTVRWALSRLLQERAGVSGEEELECKNAGAGPSSDYPMKKKEQQGPSPTAEEDDDAELDNTEVGKIRSLSQSLPLVGRKRKVWELGLGGIGQQSGKHELDKKSDSNNKEHDSVEGAVQEADSGKAGASMAERVGAWMRTPCHNLVNLISYCLSKSLEQHPPLEGSVDEISTMGSLPGADENESLNGRDSVWLHKWLVKEVMQATSVSSAQSAQSAVLHQIPLDWLIAYLIAAKPNVFVAIVLDDLVDNVVNAFNTKNSASLSIYLWRVGVLEYAALRAPVQTAAALKLFFSRMRLTGLEGEGSKKRNLSGNQREIRKAVINVWLVMATLCPQLLGACFQHWMPLLTVDSILSYSSLIAEIIQGEMPSIPLWSVLEGVTGEEPRSILAWLSAILSRRMSELASVGADIVLLLVRVIQVSNSDRMDKELPETATFMLNTLYRVLSKCVLLRILGAEQMTSGEPLTSITRYEENAGLQFVENLRMNVQKLWAELLQLCCTSTCDYCETITAPLLGLDSSQDTKKEVARINIGPTGSHSQSTTKERDSGKTQPFIGICRLTILSCGKHALAELLAEATIITPCTMEGFETKSLKRLLLVTEVMRMVSAQGRGAQVFENWAHSCVTHLSKSNDEQALHRALAIQHLLDPLFWHSHQRVLGPFSKLVLVGEEQGDDELKNFSWKVVWTLLQKMLDCQWLQLLPLLHRKNALELHLVVLHILQYLSPDNDSRPQAVVVRLKGLLGIYFDWLDGIVDNKVLKKPIESEIEGDVDKWQSVRILEQLKRVIVQQTSLASTIFTVMVSSLLDYSFERSARKADATSPYNRRRIGNMRRRGIVANGRGSLPISSLVAGRLDKHGNFTLVAGAGGNQKSSATTKYSFAEDIRRLKSGGLSSLDVYERERLGSRYGSGDQVKVLDSHRDNHGTELEEELVDTTLMELRDLLRRAVKSAVFQVTENPEMWSPHPATTLVTLMIDRLETPHEMAMTMEQYEEVLPKQVSSPRHIFLTDCFGQNQLLLEMLELVVKYRQSDEMLRCVEFIRILLADNISSWHSAYRTRRNPALPPARISEEERFDRMQVIRLINIVADAGWLPQPLASTIEIVEIIDGADIADLLLLVWRCMHHAMTFGAKSWSMSDHVIPQNGGSGDPQIHGVEEAKKEGTYTVWEGCTQIHGVEEATKEGTYTVWEGCKQIHGVEDATKEGTYTDWEGHLFAILRQNIAQIGAHFAQVYPIRRTF